MNNSVRTLKPQILWNYFADLNSVPRPSKKEQKVKQFIIDFAKKNNLNCETDDIGNILIRKSATKAFENKKTIALQSHLDMVCQKNNEINFDFDTQGIEMFVENDFVKAKGTTLGADNGIGVAAIMAILTDENIQHPALEALFTIDEETGMTGALNLKENWLQGKILLNLDTEEDNELDIGCAGGIDVTATTTFKLMNVPDEYEAIKINISGLRGGHSGMDIHKGFGNSNKILSRILFEIVKEKFHLCEIQSGGLRNAIPREGYAIIAFRTKYKSELNDKLETIQSQILSEFQTIEPNLKIELQNVQKPEKAIEKKSQQKLIYVLKSLHNGVYRMSPNIADLVEASNNVARVECINGEVKILCLTRSSVESSKFDVANSLKSILKLAKMKVQFSGSYPGWNPNPNSEILKLMESKYQELFNEKPNVVACHAGLECGIIGSHYPEMDMISFGPNIFGAHSPDEKVQISSVQKFWKYLIEILKSTN